MAGNGSEIAQAALGQSREGQPDVTIIVRNLIRLVPVVHSGSFEVLF
jgi:hypothetical protein